MKLKIDLVKEISRLSRKDFGSGQRRKQGAHLDRRREQSRKACRGREERG